jgi:hypothetical protein
VDGLSSKAAVSVERLSVGVENGVDSAGFNPVSTPGLDFDIFAGKHAH